MTATDSQLSDTRRRAALRGREAEAQWRIKSAVWTVIIGALVNGVWGTVILARVRREALIPPAPTRAPSTTAGGPDVRT